MKKRLELPVLKMPEKYIWQAISILYRFGGNREELRIHVLSMFNSDNEKSVFRGMYVPTMRSLGLTLGFGQEIYCSSNGRLLYEAYSKGPNEGARVLGKLLIEIDEANYGIIDFLKDNSPVDRKVIVEFIRSEDLSLGLIPLSDAIVTERVRRFMKYFTESRVVEAQDSHYILSKVEYQRAKADTGVISTSEFWDILFSCYNSTKEKKAGFPSVPVHDLRNEVSKQLYEKGIALTEKEFDSLVAQVSRTQSQYLIKFSRPMWESEKLLRIGDEVYSGIAIFAKER